MWLLTAADGTEGHSDALESRLERGTYPVQQALGLRAGCCTNAQQSSQGHHLQVAEHTLEVIAVQRQQRGLSQRPHACRSHVLRQKSVPCVMLWTRSDCADAWVTTPIWGITHIHSHMWVRSDMLRPTSYKIHAKAWSAHPVTCLSQQCELPEAGALANARQLRAVALVVNSEAPFLDDVEHVACSAITANASQQHGASGEHCAHVCSHMHTIHAFVEICVGCFRLSAHVQGGRATAEPHCCPWARTLVALSEDDLASNDVALHHLLRQLEPLRITQVEEDRHLQPAYKHLKPCCAMATVLCHCITICDAGPRICTQGVGSLYRATCRAVYLAQGLVAPDVLDGSQDVVKRLAVERVAHHIGVRPRI